MSPEDERAEAAKLPKVDGVDLTDYLLGKTEVSPRTEVFASPTVLVMEINGTKWKLFGNDDEVNAALPNLELAPHELNCSVENPGVCLKAAPIVRIRIT